MTLVQLQVLLAIVDAGGFTPAATHLSMTQSAVSHALATLEQELGVILIERGRGGSRLTVVGERVATHARVAVGAAEAARQEAASTRGLASGRVRLGSFPRTCGPSSASEYLGPVPRVSAPALAGGLRECGPVVA